MFSLLLSDTREESCCDDYPTSMKQEFALSSQRISDGFVVAVDGFQFMVSHGRIRRGEFANR